MLTINQIQKIRRIATKALGLNYQDADDFIADGYVRILSKNIKDVSDAYLYTTCKNAFLNKLDHRRIGPAKYRRYVREMLPVAIAEDTLIAIETSDINSYALQKALKTLTPIQLSCIMAYARNDGATTAAESLKMNLNTYNTHRKLALKHLKYQMRGLK